MPDPSLATTPDRPSAPRPSNEAQRLDALERLALLDSEPEIAFDDVVQLAATLCDVPIALVSLVDRDRQWFKARVGLDVAQTHRDLAFCAHAILQPDDLMIVDDAAADDRFRSNPLVTGDPHIRFYAGAPLRSPDGHALGTVCVIGREPRSINGNGPHAPFSTAQQQGLLALARQASALIQLRDLSISRARQTQALRRRISDALAEEPDAAGGVYSRLRHEQRVSAVGQLATGIAHDFNNLLQTVSTSLQLVQRKAEHPEHVKRWANSGMLAVEHGASLVSQLLAFSRSAKDGDDTEARQPVCFIDATIERVEDLLARVLGPEIRLTFALNAGTACIDCSPTQIEAALMNLVINARDAMRNVGAIRVSTMRSRIDSPPQTASNDASLADCATSFGIAPAAVLDAAPDQAAPPGTEGGGALPPLAPGEYVMLQVSDTGPGMPEDVAARAFEPFFTTKPANKGTGLGLAQVQAAALKAGGTARIDTSARTGTTITLWLRISRQNDDTTAAENAVAASVSVPLAHSAEPALAVATAAAAVTPHEMPSSLTDATDGTLLPQPCVLLVDDQDELRTAVAALLEEAGFLVVHASNGLTALQRIDESVPDIVVSDCAMHGFNGALLGRVLGATHPRLPILFMTGHIDLDLVRADLPVEAVLLRKPIVIDHLVSHIDAALRSHTEGKRFARVPGATQAGRDAAVDGAANDATVPTAPPNAAAPYGATPKPGA